jgi:hypothetical protein
VGSRLRLPEKQENKVRVLDSMQIAIRNSQIANRIPFRIKVVHVALTHGDGGQYAGREQVLAGYKKLYTAKSGVKK